MTVDGGFDIFRVPELRQVGGDAIAGLPRIGNESRILVAGRAQSVPGAVINMSGHFVAPDQQRIEDDLPARHLAVYPVQNEDPACQGKDKMGSEKDDIGLVKIVVVFY